MNSKSHAPDANGKGREAFTFIELLVVIAIVALLAATLLPALANSKPDSRSFRCLNNQRQLVAGWRMYAEDNNDYLAGNDFPWMTLVSSISPALAQANWAPGSMITADSKTVAYLQNPAISQLFNYLKTANVFKCPADKSLVVRSVSMNSAVGTRWAYPENGYTPPTGVLRGSQALPGGWLPGSAYNANQTTWLTYGKFSSMTRPAPANLWVIMDEHPNSINDSTIAIPAVPGYIVDYPANYHNGAAGIVFADGHSEIHRWQDARTKPPEGSSLISVTSPNNADMVWLSTKTSALR